jgi:hypothetical protein
LSEAFTITCRNSASGCDVSNKIHVGKKDLSTKWDYDCHNIPNSILYREIAVLDWWSAGDNGNLCKGGKRIR